MKLQIFPTYNELSQSAAKVIIDIIIQKHHAVVCLATGDSPLGTYTHLVQMGREQHVDFSKVHFVGLDEWVGIQPTNPGSCTHYLNKNLFDPLNISASHIHLFDGLSTNLDAECQKMNDTVQRLGGIDFMVVGIGMNGHIGFNEPGVSESLYAHSIQLEEITQSVGQKYFATETPLRKGITLGLQHFLQARAVLLVANGTKKAAIIQKTLEDTVDVKLPSTLIRKHTNGFVFLDTEAASLLKH